MTLDIREELETALYEVNAVISAAREHWQQQWEQDAEHCSGVPWEAARTPDGHLEAAPLLCAKANILFSLANLTVDGS